ncbi:hypothetical protein Lal_00022581 [Lupinus albus]|uniref:Uncharacterized protein n=1 Tax=Lupinus albus TaxID=3870 RepID=A0A6A5PCE0_LUPAL|nr:hypothetical protein Lalb_Chr15g0085331 [Lupinus albus]KAF1895084.1 hypothetical protein Lal_00022581 [Lupinus albus]
MEQKLNNNMMFVEHKKRPVHEYDFVGSFSCSSSSFVSEVSSDSSLESDSFEEVTSLPSFSSSSSHDQLDVNPLNDMSSLLEHLPMKRGLSNFYQGKSQSFTSLASVGSLEDLIKPENPHNKRLKCCRSYGVSLSECQSEKCTPSSISRPSSKKRLHSRGSCTSLYVIKGSDKFMSTRPQIPTTRSTSNATISSQTALFA